MDNPTPTPSRERASDRLVHRMGGFLLIAAAVVLLDQATKAGIRAWLHPGETWPEGWDLIHLSHVRNTGAAFGILQGAGDFLVVAALLGVGAITVLLLTLPATSRWYPVALSAILGGAIGNLADRVRLGHVTDFIDPWNYPAFNVADSAIVLGVITIAVLSFVDDNRDPSEEPAAEVAPREARPSEEVRS